MGKFSLILSYSNFTSAVGLISVIVGLIFFLIINKKATKFFFKVIDRTEDVLDENEEIRIKNFILGSKESKIYGPDNLLKFQAVVNLILAVQFIVMGIVYIASEKNQIDIYKSIKKCFNLNK